MKKILAWLDCFMSSDRRNDDLLRLAKTEYGKDWQYAYHCYMSKKPINHRFVQGIE